MAAEFAVLVHGCQVDFVPFIMKLQRLLFWNMTFHQWRYFDRPNHGLKNMPQQYIVQYIFVNGVIDKLLLQC